MYDRLVAEGRAVPEVLNQEFGPAVKAEEVVKHDVLEAPAAGSKKKKGKK